MITDWTAPNDIPEGHVRRRTLIAEIEEIDAQLRDKNKRKDMGDDAWWTWRTKALWARTHRTQDLRLTKEWIYANEG